MVLSNTSPLLISLLLVLLVMAMVFVEDIGELSSLVFRVHDLDHGLLKLGTRELTLNILDLLAGSVVERVE